MPNLDNKSWFRLTKSDAFSTRANTMYRKHSVIIQKAKLELRELQRFSVLLTGIASCKTLLHPSFSPVGMPHMEQSQDKTPQK